MIKKKGPAPYGFRKNEDGLVVPCKTEQLVLWKIKKLRDNGYSYARIARKINLEGRFPRSGRVWTKKNIRELFTNKRFVAVGKPAANSGGLECVDPKDPNNVIDQEVTIEEKEIEPSWIEMVIDSTKDSETKTYAKSILRIQKLWKKLS